MEGVILVVLLLACWLRHRAGAQLRHFIATVGGFYIVAAGACMLLSKWCPWSAAIVAKKREYIMILGGLLMIWWGFGVFFRAGFGQGAALDDASVADGGDAAGGE